MEIVWSESSFQRLEEIGHFIATDSPTRAREFIDRLIESVERLREFPLSGSVMPENSAFRQIVVQGYRIIYRQMASAVEIVTVVSPGQRPSTWRLYLSAWLAFPLIHLEPWMAWPALQKYWENLDWSQPSRELCWMSLSILKKFEPFLTSRLKDWIL